MTTTVKALIVGTALALSALATAQVALQPAVTKLDSVVVAAQRLPAQPGVVILDSVVVTATRAEALAAQFEEATKQAGVATRKGS
jgi:hypothetical protein